MILHTDLFVESMDRALDFYCRQLGFQIADDSILHGRLVNILSNGCYESLRLVLISVAPTGSMLELVEFQSESMTSKEVTPPKRTGWVSILVDDLDAHVNATIKNGLSPVTDIFAVRLPASGTCKLVIYIDPDGNGIEFVQVQQQRRRGMSADLTV